MVRNRRACRPAGLPRQLVTKLNADIAQILHEPGTKEKFGRLDAALVEGSSADAFGRLLKAEYARYRKLFNDSGIQAQ